MITHFRDISYIVFSGYLLKKNPLELNLLLNVVNPFQ
jgi:hypothetical protein